MVGLQTLDLAIGVRVPVSQPFGMNKIGRPSRTPYLVLCAYSVPTSKKALIVCRSS